MGVKRKEKDFLFFASGTQKMESSLREYVCEQITGYSDNVKKYFDSLAIVAETATNEESSYPEEIIQQMALVDQNLQRAVEHSKVIKYNKDIFLLTIQSS